MDVKTYRAGSLQEALRVIRQDLGPDAAVLHTREVPQGVMRWLKGRQVEVTASASVRVPSRFESSPPKQTSASTATAVPAAHYDDFRARFRDAIRDDVAQSTSLVEDLCRESSDHSKRDLPESLFEGYMQLLDAEVPEQAAREMLEQLRVACSGDELEDSVIVRTRLARQLEDQIRCSGPIRVTPGQQRTVALVGPTGVGKTTTIAKLAGNFRVREQRRVGLIAVDTYRIAAVEQLRTYADIIDLPMEVVTTPREMRAAISRFADLDLVLMDTAGRSPRDEIRIQKLKTMLAEATPDEVHLVLSSVANPATLKQAAERFIDVGANRLLVTKLDEATGVGGILPLITTCGLPLSYLTDGQDVPNDIAPAESRKLARMVLGHELA
ncbi:MAG: flagellar biosynthesis protein FlhF [Planctomycetaceae bacterium]|nr:flagellar biosynthesis protein FlhF [Planctomycetaceae bacterium]